MLTMASQVCMYRLHKPVQQHVLHTSNMLSTQIEADAWTAGGSPRYASTVIVTSYLRIVIISEIEKQCAHRANAGPAHLSSCKGCHFSAFAILTQVHQQVSMREICKLIQTAQKGYKQSRQITRHGNSTPFVSDISPVSTADVHVPVGKKSSGGRVMQPYLTEELTPPCQVAGGKDGHTEQIQSELYTVIW